MTVATDASNVPSSREQPERHAASWSPYLIAASIAFGLVVAWAGICAV